MSKSIEGIVDNTDQMESFILCIGITNNTMILQIKVNRH